MMKGEESRDEKMVAFCKVQGVNVKVQVNGKKVSDNHA